MVAEEVVLNLVEVVLRVWIARGMRKVLICASYAVFGRHCEARMEVLDVLGAAYDVEAKQPLAGHACTDVSGLEKALRGVGLTA